MKKYKLLRKNKEGLHRIKSLKDFSDVKKGDLGGFVESEANLSHDGNCWIYDNGVVSDNGVVRGNGLVRGNGVVRGNGIVCENAIVRGNGVVSGNGVVRDYGEVRGNGVVRENGIVSGYATATKPVIYIVGLCKFDITITDNHIRIGCNQHTFDEAINIYNNWKKAKVDNPRLKEVEHIKTSLYNLIIERIKEITK